MLHDRNPVFVRLSDGAIRNAYTVRITNKRAERREFTLSISGLAGSLLDVVQTRDDGRFVVEVGPDQTREVRVLVTDYADLPPALHADQFPPLRRDDRRAGVRRATTSARPQEDEMIANDNELPAPADRPHGSHLPDRVLRRRRRS